MRPLHIALLAAALASGIALYVLVVRDSGSSEKTVATAPDPSATTKSESGDVGSKTSGGSSDTTNDTSDTNDTGDTDDTGNADDDREVTELVGKTGNRVRDYRGTGAPMRDPDAPLTRPFKSKRIDSGVVVSMAKELRKAGRACRDSHPEGIGEDAKVQTRATFAIHQERLTVNAVELTLESIPENGGFHSCIESAALGITVEAPGHREVEKDMMSVPIRL